MKRINQEANANVAGKKRRIISSSQRQGRFGRNLELSEKFRLLSKLHQKCPLLEEDTWRAYTYSIAAGRLRNLEFTIVNNPRVLERVRHIKGFGSGIMEKIEQYLETGEIQRIVSFQQDEKRIAMKTMMGIWGVGRKRVSYLLVRMASPFQLLGLIFL